MHETEFMYGISLVPRNCYKCGIVFAVPKKFDLNRREDHREFWCPNGHGQIFPEPEKKEPIEQDIEARRELVLALHRADQAEAKAAAAESIPRMMIEHIEQIADERIKCKHCAATFKSEAAHQRHMRRTHPEVSA